MGIQPAHPVRWIPRITVCWGLKKSTNVNHQRYPTIAHQPFDHLPPGRTKGGCCFFRDCRRKRTLRRRDAPFFLGFSSGSPVTRMNIQCAWCPSGWGFDSQPCQAIGFKNFCIKGGYQVSQDILTLHFLQVILLQGHGNMAVEIDFGLKENSDSVRLGVMAGIAPVGSCTTWVMLNFNSSHRSTVFHSVLGKWVGAWWLGTFYITVYTLW